MKIGKEKQTVLLAFSKRAAGTAVIISMMMNFSGCTNEDTISPTTTCNVYAIENAVGGHKCVCGNGENVYLSENYGIYQYTDREIEQLVYIGKDVCSMACNKEELYYVTRGSELYRLDLTTNEVECVSEGKPIWEVVAHEDDIFVIMSEIENDGYDEEDVVAYCVTGEKESWENLNELLEEKIEENEVYTTMDYKDYQIGGCKKHIEKSNGEVMEYIKVMTISTEDGWRYSYERAAMSEDSKVRIDKEGKLLEIGNRDYTYDAQVYESEEVLAIDDYGSATTSTLCTVQDGKVYALYQYGKGTPGGSPNPSAAFKNCDALFCLKPEEGKWELLYKTEEEAQIAGFSVENQVIYLLCNDGVYSCDFDGENKKKLMENNSETMGFEYYDGKIYVFDEKESFTGAFIGTLE